MTSSAQTSRSSAKADSRESLRLAAIDVGSNSIHMIVAQADADGGITTLWRLKEPVGLGRLSFPSRRLSADAVNRAVTVLERFQQAAQQRQAEKIVAVATSAIREAENGGDLIERVRRDLGLYVRVVSPREEARLIYLAVRHAMALRSQPHLLIDIGGGSVEFIVGDDKHAALLESRKLGAARMTAQFVKSDPINDADHNALLKHYESALTPLVGQIQALRPVKTIGTSGTLENLAAMCGSEPNHNGNAPDHFQVIEKDRFEKLLAQLLESRAKDRAHIRGLDDQRKDQIVAGAVLVSELFRRLRLKRIDICPSALREGILLDYLSRHLPDLAIRRQLPDPRRRSVIDLARRCDWHKTHSEHVAHICMRLFDELRLLHGMGAAERELIEYGALLHDIGWHIARDKHHKHSMYLILNGDLKNFSDDEIKTIANIARYHRKGTPKSRHDPYTSLSPRLRRVVDVGAALLRLSDGLDRSHSSVIPDLRCKIENKRVKWRLTAKSDAELEIWAPGEKGIGSRRFSADRSLLNWPKSRNVQPMETDMDSLLTPHNFPGKLIVVEGIDGSGKSTQLQLAMRYLQAKGLPVFFTEWNSADLVKAITKRGKKKMSLTPMTFSLLHATDFAHRLVQGILPPLKAGMIVLADRYVYTAFARDVIRGCDREWVRQVYQFAPRPDRAFYFNVPIDVSVSRLLSGRAKLKDYEAGMDLGLAPDLVNSFKLFQGQILLEYARVTSEYGLTEIDATQSIGDQQHLVRSLIDETLADYSAVQA